MQDQIQETLNTLSSKFPDQLKFVSRPLILSEASIDTPSIATDFITLFLDGSIIYKGKSVSDVSSPSTLINSDPKLQKEFQAFISDYLLNTGLAAMNENNYLQSSFSGVQFTTNNFEKILPGITQQYGANKMIKLACVSDTNNAPSVTLKKGSPTGNFAGSCDLIVIDGSNQNKVISFTGTGIFNIKAQIKKNSSLNFNFMVSQVTISSVSNSTLQNTPDVTTMSASFNKLLKVLRIFRNFELPRIPMINLSSSKMIYGDGYIEVGAMTKINLMD